MVKVLYAVACIAILSGAAFWAVRSNEQTQTAAAGSEAADWSEALQSLSDEGFERPAPDWVLTLPADHAAHTPYRTESWQVSAHLTTEQGRPLGLQFSLLRLGIVPPDAPQPSSVWQIRDLYRGHMTLLGAEPDMVLGEERLARGLPTIVGYDAEERALRLDNWVFGFGEGATDTDLTLVATIQGRTEVELVLRPRKEAIALAPRGADAPFAGYAYTRLFVEGTITDVDTVERVSGMAWLDHAWGDLPIPGTGPVAWDRVQFQLDNGTDVSVLRARRTEGRGAATINGLVVDAVGGISTFDEDDVRMSATRHWRNPETGAEYPVAWRIEGPEFDVMLDPLLDAQHHDFTIPFWGGAMTVAGQWQGKETAGQGSLQLTGYEDR